MAQALAMARAGRPADAAAEASRLATDTPASAGAADVAAALARGLGNHSQALRWRAEALRRSPTAARRLEVALALSDAGRHAEAEPVLRRELRNRPDDPSLLAAMGRARLADGAPAAAAQLLGRAATLRPEDPELHATHAAALTWIGALDAAVKAWLAALHAGRPDADRLARIGRGLIDAGALDAGERALQLALRMAPGHPRATLGLAHLEERTGRPAHARARLEPLIAQGLRSHGVLATWAAACQQSGAPSRPLGLLRAALADDLPAPARVALSRSLGTSLDALGMDANAWDAHAAANAAHGLDWDAPGHTALTHQIMRAYPGRPARPANAASPHPRPILIIGMPRSGTSLLEQALAAHPHVHAAGERQELGRFTLGDGAPGWPARAAGMSDGDAATHGARWRALIGGEGARCVTEKTPLNVLFLGHAARMLPDARVIWVVRNPRDVALSCLFTTFHSNYAFTNRQDWLATWIHGHQRLVRHWQRTLPLPGHTVRYDSLVANPEATLRETLQFMGLQWDPACLHPERVSRVVRTASYAQVRRPFHTGSVGRWRRFEAQLAPLIAALGPT